MSIHAMFFTVTQLCAREIGFQRRERFDLWVQMKTHTNGLYLVQTDGMLPPHEFQASCSDIGKKLYRWRQECKFYLLGLDLNSNLYMGTGFLYYSMGNPV